MFDPQTTELIHRAPQLEGLDLERLPQDLTKAFTSIVAARVRLQQDAPLPGDLLPLVRRFRRLASTFETMVAVSPRRENRASAAYVSAQAHHLLHLARGFEAGGQEGQEHLRADSISPEVSALLLFLIADQPSDAMEMAKIILDRPILGGEVQIALTRALCALARGDLDEIAVNPASLFSIGDDYMEAASPALYFQLLGALRLLAVRLLRGTTATEGATEMFRSVQRISIEAVDLPALAGEGFEFIALQTEESRFTALNTFLGPHHLATLLISAGDHLLKCATSSISPPSGVSPQSWKKILPRLVSQRPYLWRNHQKAIDDGLLSIGTSAVVSFPTGAGKSTLSELKAAATLAAGESVLYLAPTHALVAQVQRCFRYSFRGIPVGSSRIYDDAYAEVEDRLPNVAIMTPERCLALLTLQEDVFDGFGLIVFDECHLLHPKGGGHNRRSLDALLCILNLAKALPHADWLFLSAMMENATDIAGWVQHYTGKTCLALNLDWKPTRQARGCVVYRSTEIIALRTHLRNLEPKARKANGKLPAPNASVHKSLNATPHGFFCLRQTWQTLESEDYSLVEFANTGIQLSASLTAAKTRWRLMPNKNHVAAQISALFAERTLKVLIFAQTKDHTDSIARDASRVLEDTGPGSKFTPSESVLLKVAIEEAGGEDHLYLPHSNLAACHHGGMLVAERELVESMFRRPDGLNVLAATPTLAQGMNLPADVVLIVGEERFDAEAGGAQPIEPHELLNAAGRAGRAGQVSQGLVLVIPNNLVTYNAEKQQIDPRWEEIRSRIFSRSDQCLTITDPLEAILDTIQQAGNADDPEVRYFLRRLPFDDQNNPGSTAAFLRNSLAAYHAKQHGLTQAFDDKIRIALGFRDREVADISELTWFDRVASKSGVPASFVEELHQALLTVDATAIANTKELLVWFFQWMDAEDDREQIIFGHRRSFLPSKGDPVKRLVQPDMFGTDLLNATWAWMTAKPLNVLEPMLGGRVDRLGKCKHARKFVLQQIPDLAYAAGLLSQIFRQQIEQGEREQMPLSLAVLSQCVREGHEHPEELAIRRFYDDRLLSRIEVLRIFNTQADRLRFRDPFGSFSDVRDHVSNVLSSN